MDNTTPHIPVLLQQTIDLLDLKSSDIVIDGTMGYGGHSTAILERIPDGKLIGIDQDPVAIDYCSAQFKDKKNVSIHHNNFSNFPAVLNKINIPKADKILVDLGMSSYHLDSAERGFSFQAEDETLDMRMNPSTDQATAADILATYSEDDLIQIFQDYGELRRPEKFASTILTHRKKESITRISDLIPLIKKSFFFRNKRHVYIKTVSQVFQALRIEVNQELDHLHTFLDQVIPHLNPGGRLVVISFHSLEDRIVKRYIKAHKYELDNLTKKIITATQDEIKENSRSKPAKLRGAQRCDS